MKTRDQSRLASTISLLVGIWVLLSPIWISVTGGALVSIIITGIVIIAASVVQYFMVNTAVPSWIVGVASLWLLLSAVVFGVSAAAGWSQILAAIVGLLSAYWDGFEVTNMVDQSHRHGPSAV